MTRRESRGRRWRKIVDSAKRTQKTVSELYEGWKKIGEGDFLGCWVRMQEHEWKYVCVRERLSDKCSEFAVISLNGVDSLPGWKARHEVERLRQSDDTCGNARFLSRFISPFLHVKRRGDVQNKIKEKRVILKGPRHARANFCRHHRACLVSAPPRDVFDFSCTSLFALFLSFCWVSRSMFGVRSSQLKSAKFNRVPRWGETGVAKHAARPQPMSCYPQKG